LPLNNYLVSHLAQFLLLHYQGNADQAKCALKCAKMWKNIPNIIDHNSYLKKQYRTLITKNNNFWLKYFLTRLAMEWLFKFPPHPTFALALPGESRPSKSYVEMNKKNNKFYLSRSLGFNSQSIRRFDRHKAVMTFRNVYEFKKWLVKSGLLWSRTLLILLSINVESVSMLVFAQCAYNLSNFAVNS